MKKLLTIGVLSTCAAFSYPAAAQVSVTFGEPAPVYAAPAPVGVVEDWPSQRFNHRHHPHDWARAREEERLHRR